MSTEPEFAPPGHDMPARPDPPSRLFNEPMREIVALVLLGATGVLLLTSIMHLVPSPIGETFTTRAQFGFAGFVGVPTIGFPLLAVLLATRPWPPVPRAGLITILALAQYAVAGFFGVVFGVFVGVTSAAGAGYRYAVEALLERTAWLAVLALAAFAVVQTLRHLYPAARPMPNPAGGSAGPGWTYPPAGPPGGGGPAGFDPTRAFGPSHGATDHTGPVRGDGGHPPYR